MMMLATVCVFVMTPAAQAHQYRAADTQLENHPTVAGLIQCIRQVQ
jgi:hypothetical protein